MWCSTIVLLVEIFLVFIFFYKKEMTCTIQDVSDRMYLRDYVRVGRSMCAKRGFAVGEVVLKDAPVLVWDPRQPLAQPEIQSLKDGEPLVPQMYAAAVDAYLRPTNSRSTRDVIRDMWSPNLPISEHTSALFRFATRVLEGIQKPVAYEADEESDTPSTLVHVMIAAKVNAHRTSTGSWCMMPIGSKFAHSCDPNMFYHAQASAFIALRPISSGEVLSFSYLAQNHLMCSTEMRQKKLFGTHMFTCVCPRCRATDHPRAVPCPQCNVGLVKRFKSRLLLEDADVEPSGTKLWHCSGCGNHFSDADLEESTLRFERTLVDQVEAVGGAGQSGYKYKDLKTLIRVIRAKLGTSHWTFARMAYHFALYFRTLANNGFGDSATHMFGNWSLIYLSKLEDLGISYETPTPHPLLVSFILTFVTACSTFPKYRPVLCELAVAIKPFMVACYGGDDTRLRIVQKLASEVGGSTPRRPLRALILEVEDVGDKILNGSEDVEEWLFRIWDTMVALHLWKMSNGGGEAGDNGEGFGLSQSNTTQSSLQSLDEASE